MGVVVDCPVNSGPQLAFCVLVWALLHSRSATSGLAGRSALETEIYAASVARTGRVHASQLH